MAWLYGDTAVFRELALLVLAVLLHPGPGEVALVSSHPASDLKRLRIRLPRYAADGSATAGTRWAERTDYWAEPVFFRYDCGNTQFIGDPRSRPLIKITNENELGGWGDDWMSRRDTLVVVGPDVAMVAIAQHLLDAAVRDNVGTVDWWDSSYNGNLAHHSAELRLVFPHDPRHEDLVPPLAP